jgi:hypothetical protein
MFLDGLPYILNYSAPIAAVTKEPLGVLSWDCVEGLEKVERGVPTRAN